MIKAELEVKTKNGKYSIIIGTNFLNQLSKIFKRKGLNFNKCFLLIDKKIGKKKLKKYLVRYQRKK